FINLDTPTADLAACRNAAVFLAARLENAGLSVTRHSCGADGRPLLTAVSPSAGYSKTQSKNSEGSAEKTYDFLLVGHFDTVFPAGTAAQRPFRLDAAEGRVYGPGTVDMKAGVLLMIYLAEYLTAVHPDIRLCLLLDCDEETGSSNSAPFLTEYGKKSRCAFIFEGARKAGQFVSQRKGCRKYEIEITGVASHAGTAPRQGASAIVEMARWITALDKLKRYDKGTSVNIGLVQGGTALNVVPDRCTAKMEVRYTDEKEILRIERSITRLSRKPSVENTQAHVTCLSDMLPLRLSPETRVLMDQMAAYGVEHQNEIEAGFFDPIDFVSAGGLSDANRLAACGIPVMDGCGPGGGFPHSEKEFLSLDSLQKRHRLLTGLLPYLYRQMNA
ncbi:MAG: M20/M25/M40 family metallo-hydrolase, partial [Firmicutes bacterium]|nr:M20/M25/M40 family metallo-hydrolase [Bacillota bacterium]